MSAYIAMGESPGNHDMCLGITVHCNGDTHAEVNSAFREAEAKCDSERQP
jgi:hypothetical protein